MRKRHFIALADAIRSIDPGTDSPGRMQYNNTLEVLADFCAGQNPRFNRQRWLDYIAGECGPSGGEVRQS